MSKIDDSTKLRNVIDALGLSPNAFSIKIGYKSHRSVYQVLDNPDTYGISPGMVDRIIKAFPKVNYNYLTHNELPILLEESGMMAQANALNIPIQHDGETYKIQRALNMPDQLDRIEEKLDIIIKRTEKS